jgi:hypothetical protein
VLGRRFYERLGAICRGPFAEAFLGGDLTEQRIAFYEALSRMDPATVALRDAFGENRFIMDSVDCMVLFLRAHGALRDDDVRLPSGAGKSAAARRIRDALGRIDAPHPGFVVPEPFRLVRTADELQRLAKSFENCLALPVWGAAKYHVNLVNGSAVFLTSDDPPLLAALHRVADGLWQFEQCAGPKNVLPPPGVKAALVRQLVAAGLRIVETDAQSALERIEHEATRRQDSEDDRDDYLDDEEGNEEDGDEIAA